MVRRQIERVVDVQPGELAPAALAACCFFCLLFGYFILRPLRETMGLEAGVDSLHFLYLGTLGGTLAATLVYGWLVSRLPRRLFIPIVYRFAIICLIVFVSLLYVGGSGPGAALGGAFYIWLSVSNVLWTAVFWGLLADVFTLDQGKRLFAFIGVGGTAGAIAGSSVSWQLASALGPIGLMIVAAALLEAAAQLGKHLVRVGDDRGFQAPASSTGTTVGREAGVEASPWSGFTQLLRSPYLLAIAGFLCLYPLLSTLLYFEKMRIVGDAIEQTDARTSVFALIELIGQTMTVLLQLFLAGRLMRLLGVGAMLAVVPVVSIAGFAALAAAPTLMVVAVFEASRRASHFALTKPARETLYTVLTRDEKYKAKALIDTFVYRGADVVGTLADRAVAAAAAAAAVIAVPLGLIGVVLAFVLGAMERRRSSRASGAAGSLKPRVSTAVAPTGA